MKEWRGLYLPDNEQHLIEWMQKKNQIVDGKPTYQYHKLTAALTFVKDWRCAIDVGAHCGLWSMHLQKRFDVLHAFEPVEAHRECFEMNVERGDDDVYLYPYALGDHDGRVGMHVGRESSGDSYVEGDGNFRLSTLDRLELGNVDFIKLDCEGYEVFALRGGEQTLLKNRPIICVEQKPGKASQFGVPDHAAILYLQGLGARVLRRLPGDDFIMGWQ